MNDELGRLLGDVLRAISVVEQRRQLREVLVFASDHDTERELASDLISGLAALLAMQSMEIETEALAFLRKKIAKGRQKVAELDAAKAEPAPAAS